MKRNMGAVDRVIRVVVAIVLFYAATTIAMPSWLAIVLGIIGALMLVTAAIGVCWLYSLIGVKTCKTCTCKPGEPCDEHAPKEEKPIVPPRI
jgi:hypothetical protein